MGLHEIFYWIMLRKSVKLFHLFRSDMCRTLSMNTCDCTPPGYEHVAVGSCEKSKKIVAFLGGLHSYNVMLSSIWKSTLHSHPTCFCVLLTLVQLHTVLICCLCVVHALTTGLFVPSLVLASLSHSISFSIWYTNKTCCSVVFFLLLSHIYYCWFPNCLCWAFMDKCGCLLNCMCSALHMV
jgi:hypothetical protein